MQLQHLTGLERGAWSDWHLSGQGWLVLHFALPASRRLLCHLRQAVTSACCGSVALTAATLALALNNIFEKKNHAKPNGNR